MILTLATYVLLPYLRCARAPQGFGMLSAPVVAEVLMSTRARTPRCPFCGGQIRWFPVCLQVHTDGLLEARCASSLSHLFRFADERASKLVSEQQQQQRLGNSHVGIMYLDLHRSSSSLSSSSSTHTHTHTRAYAHTSRRCGAAVVSTIEAQHEVNGEKSGSLLSPIHKSICSPCWHQISPTLITHLEIQQPPRPRGTKNFP
ncbi:hypothetical protein IWX50DRAFT_642547 [Phyllosticta citricarpa]